MQKKRTTCLSLPFNMKANKLVVWWTEYEQNEINFHRLFIFWMNFPWRRGTQSHNGNINASWSKKSHTLLIFRFDHDKLESILSSDVYWKSKVLFLHEAQLTKAFCKNIQDGQILKFKDFTTLVAQERDEKAEGGWRLGERGERARWQVSSFGIEIPKFILLLNENFKWTSVTFVH